MSELIDQGQLLLERLETRRWYDNPLFDGRSRAAKKLAALGDQRAREPLAQICHRRRPDGGFDQSALAIDCAIALARLGDERAVEPLLQVLHQEEYEWIRPEAVKALGSVRDRRAVDVLMDLFLDPSDHTLNDLAANALAQIGEPAVRDLVHALAHEDYPVFNAAKVALVKIGPPAVKRLAKALDSRNPDLRVRAFQVLQQIDSPAAKAAVQRYLQREKRKRPRREEEKRP